MSKRTYAEMNAALATQNWVAAPRIYLRKWNIKNLVDVPIVVIQGIRRSGKSVLAKELMQKTSKSFAGGVLFSGTEKLAPYLGKFMHRNVVHHGLNIKMFTELVHNRVETIGEHNASLSNSEIAANKANHNWSTLIILEDCLKNYPEWKSSGATFELFFNGRHADMGLLLLTQEAKCIPPSCRSNVEYLFIFQESGKRNLTILYKEYCNFIPEAIFYQLMEKVGKQYHCIVVDFNVKSSNSWQDKVFWYKADSNDEHFRFGSQEAWDYNDQIIRDRTLAIYEKMKKQQEEKEEMAAWIAKLGSTEQTTTVSSGLEQQNNASTNLRDRFF